MEKTEQPNQECIKTLEEKENYTYFGIFEVNATKLEEMKEKKIKIVHQTNE